MELEFPIMPVPGGDEFLATFKRIPQIKLGIISDAIYSPQKHSADSSTFIFVRLF